MSLRTQNPGERPTRKVLAASTGERPEPAAKPSTVVRTAASPVPSGGIAELGGPLARSLTHPLHSIDDEGVRARKVARAQAKIDRTKILAGEALDQDNEYAVKLASAHDRIQATRAMLAPPLPSMRVRSDADELPLMAARTPEDLAEALADETPANVRFTSGNLADDDDDDVTESVPPVIDPGPFVIVGQVFTPPAETPATSEGPPDDYVGCPYCGVQCEVRDFGTDEVTVTHTPPRCPTFGTLTAPEFLALARYRVTEPLPSEPVEDDEHAPTSDDAPKE